MIKEVVIEVRCFKNIGTGLYPFPKAGSNHSLNSCSITLLLAQILPILV
jgi:hypothetical protein